MKTAVGAVSTTVGLLFISIRCGSVAFGTLKVQEYSIQVKYSDTDCWVSGLETDPRKCLENPYCIVYVWNGKAIAKDFKVREEYIAPNGKTHLIAPRKKKAKGRIEK